MFHSQLLLFQFDDEICCCCCYCLATSADAICNSTDFLVGAPQALSPTEPLREIAIGCNSLNNTAADFDADCINSGAGALVSGHSWDCIACMSTVTMYDLSPELAVDGLTTVNSCLNAYLLNLGNSDSTVPPCMSWVDSTFLQVCYPDAPTTEAPTGNSNGAAPVHVGLMLGAAIAVASLF